MIGERETQLRGFQASIARLGILCLGMVFLLSGATCKPGEKTPATSPTAQPFDQLRGFHVKPTNEQQVSSVQGITPTIPSGSPISFTYWQGNFAPSSQDQYLVTLINNHRGSLGVDPVVWHGGLGKAARDHNIAMAGNISFVANYPASLGPPGLWDIPGRLGQAQPKITFTDLGIILAEQQAPNVTLSAGVFFYGGILGDPFARKIVEDPRFSTVGCSLNGDFGTTVVILGQNVQPPG